MDFTGLVNITQTTPILLKYEKVRLAQEHGHLTQVNTIMLLMVNMEVCGELEVEYLLKFVG